MDTRKLFYGTLIGLMAVALSFTAIAKDEEEAETEIVRPMEISGEVSHIGASSMNLIFKKDTTNKKEYEIMLLLNSDVEFVRKEKEELEIGDKVKVKCDEYFKLTEEGEERFAKRVTKEVKFMSPGLKGRLVGGVGD